MTDPLKLADQAETCANLVRDRGADDLAFVQLALSEQEARLLAAALRLAEWRLRVEDETCQAGGSVQENAEAEALDAYRKAKDGSK